MGNRPQTRTSGSPPRVRHLFLSSRYLDPRTPVNHRFGYLAGGAPLIMFITKRPTDLIEHLRCVASLSITQYFNGYVSKMRLPIAELAPFERCSISSSLLIDDYLDPVAGDIDINLPIMICTTIPMIFDFVSTMQFASEVRVREIGPA